MLCAVNPIQELLYSSIENVIFPSSIQHKWKCASKINKSSMNGLDLCPRFIIIGLVIEIHYDFNRALDTQRNSLSLVDLAANIE